MNQNKEHSSICLFDTHNQCTCSLRHAPETEANYLKTGPTHCLYCHLDFTHKFIAHFNIHELNEHKAVPCEEVKCKAYKTKTWPEINEATMAPSVVNFNKKNVENEFKIRKLNFVMGMNISLSIIATKMDEIIDYLRDQRL